VNRKRLQLDQQPVTVKQYVHRKLEGLDLRQRVRDQRRKRAAEQMRRRAK
jgi:hypothetical protein